MQLYVKLQQIEICLHFLQVYNTLIFFNPWDILWKEIEEWWNIMIYLKDLLRRLSIF